MGPLEVLVIVLVIVLVWRGPKMLPRIGAAFGRTVKSVRENVPGAMNDDDSETSGSADPGDKTDS